MHLSAWLPWVPWSDISCSYELYFLDFENDRVATKLSDFRLTSVKTVWKTIRCHFFFLMLYSATVHKGKMTTDNKYASSMMVGQTLRESSSRLTLPSRKCLCHLKISLLLTYIVHITSCNFLLRLLRRQAWFSIKLHCYPGFHVNVRTNHLAESLDTFIINGTVQHQETEMMSDFVS